MGDTEGDLGRRAVLIIDDDPQVRELLGSALTEAGAAVVTAGSGEDGLRLLDAGTPDLILLDLYMPGMDGWQFLERLPASHRLPPPVVLETSADDYVSLQKARQLGVAAFVSKPFRLNEVVETCRRVLGGARPLQGRSLAPLSPPHVAVDAGEGPVLAEGDLLELSDDGAQVALDTALPLGRRFRFLVRPEQHGIREITAEVRWVRSGNGQFVHGLLLHH